MAIATVDAIYNDLIELLGTEVLQMKAYAHDIAKAGNNNLFEAAEMNAKADGMRKALLECVRLSILSRVLELRQ